MKPYDKWLAFKYTEHVSDDFIIKMLSNTMELDRMITDLDLNITNRELLAHDFKSQARRYKEYSGMEQHMLMLADYIEKRQEHLALKAIEVKSAEMRKILAIKEDPRWRR